MMRTALILEDHPAINQLLCRVCEQCSLRAQSALTLNQAYDQLTAHHFDIALIDLKLPDGDGHDFIEYAHFQNPEMPIVVVSNRAGVSARVLELNSGADDYLTKPFAPEELQARLRLLLSRQKVSPLEEIRWDNVRYFPGSQLLIVDHHRIPLSLREHQVLLMLCKHQGVYVSRDAIVVSIWGSDSDVTLKTVDAYIARLRQKLGKYRDIIVSTRGRGYVVRNPNRWGTMSEYAEPLNP